MREVTGGEAGERVLILAPTAKDAAASKAILEREGFRCVICRDLDALCGEAHMGAGAALLTEEAILADRRCLLAALVKEQPAWSDLPLLVLTAAGADSPRTVAIIGSLGHTTLVKRPVQVATLISTLAFALRDRRRQYQLRDHLIEREAQAERLREADRRKDEFLAMLAHELRNPLAAISNATHLARLTREAGVSDHCHEVVDRQVAHLTRMVGDLLDVSRFTRGTIELHKVPLMLAAILEGAIETARPFIEAKGHLLTRTIAAEPMQIEGDPTRLEQVLVNLLHNAAKYSEPGGRIAVNAEIEAGRAVVRIADTGIGMTPELIGRAFNLFAQGEGSLARVEGGLGIGLTLVKSLVELHGGSIAAASDGPGKGSELTVRLPLMEGPAMSGAGPVGERAVFRRRRVLIVDDNPILLAGMRDLIGYLGHQVAVARDGPEAIAEAKRFGPEVVLLDVGLPGMDGFEVARSLREEGFGEAVIIGVSGYHPSEGGVQPWDASFDHYLLKPIDYDSLAGLISG
jgi:signal transduction histidine kinase